MAVEKTFKIINFKVLPRNGYFLAGGKGIFPQPFFPHHHPHSLPLSPRKKDKVAQQENLSQIKTLKT